MSSLQFWLTNKHVTISFLFFLSFFIFIHVTSMAEGRGIQKPLMEGRKVEGKSSSPEPLEEEGMMRSQIGSQPPSCRRRCKECGGDCEAVQVPVALQYSHQNQRKRRSSSSSHFSAAVKTPENASKHNVAQSSEDETSNYKPISWKCKCGNFIFNP